MEALAEENARLRARIAELEDELRKARQLGPPKGVTRVVAEARLGPARIAYDKEKSVLDEMTTRLTATDAEWRAERKKTHAQGYSADKAAQLDKAVGALEAEIDLQRDVVKRRRSVVRRYERQIERWDAYEKQSESSSSSSEQQHQDEARTPEYAPDDAVGAYLKRLEDNGIDVDKRLDDALRENGYRPTRERVARKVTSFVTMMRKHGVYVGAEKLASAIRLSGDYATDTRIWQYFRDGIAATLRDRALPSVLPKPRAALTPLQAQDAVDRARREYERAQSEYERTLYASEHPPRGADKAVLDVLDDAYDSALFAQQTALAVLRDAESTLRNLLRAGEASGKLQRVHERVK